MALDYERLRLALAHERLPAAFVDLAAFDRNLERQAALVAGHGLPLRLATKSIRAPELVRRAQRLGAGRLAGLMTFSARETEWLAGEGFDDLLLAYPVAHPEDLASVARVAARGAKLSVAMDDADAISRLAAVARAHGAEVSVVLCLDMAQELGDGRVHLGVRRSPLRSPEQVVTLARHVVETAGVRFEGLLAYEAQVAGLGDASPWSRLQNPVKSLIRAAGARDVAARRRAIVEALSRAGLAPRLVNGGGTGSLDSTTRASGVTEVTAGSGLFKPHLFDYYRAPHVRALEPAAFFALVVTRLPGPGYATCHGGGYVASGGAGPDKLPLPYLPEGLRLTGMEGAGEVQTPLETGGRALAIGDPVIFRHAKAGELCERFDHLLVWEGERFEGRVPTYRGLGLALG
jgi:D-serine deaminase-like pyridoxal phosphate-dependent protein